MDPGDYYKKPLPPTLYSRVERFFWFNWKFILLALVFAYFFIFPFFYDEPLDGYYGGASYDMTSR